MRVNKQFALLAAVGLLSIAASAGVGVSSAYFTDADSLENTFTTASVNVSLSEKGFDEVKDLSGPGGAKDLVQGRTVVKDPVVKNNSTVPVYAIVKVKVPYMNVMTVDTAPSKSDTQLFSYQVNPGWKLLGSSTEAGGVVNDGGYKVYWYGYTTPLEIGASTPAVFPSVTFADVVEGEILPETQLSLDVQAWGIQSQTFSSVDEVFESGFDEGQNSSAQVDKPDDRNRK